MTKGSVGYQAATSRLGVMEREDRVRWTLSGRAPDQMFDGLFTSSVPVEPHPSPGSTDTHSVRIVYGALLTAKGRMITDLRIGRCGSSAPGLLLDLPDSGATAASAHLQKFLPPRMARVHDITAETAMVSVVGPEAAKSLAEVVDPVDVADLSSLVEGDALRFEVGSDGVAPDLWIVATAEVAAPAFDVIGPRDSVQSLTSALRTLDAATVEPGDLEMLRVEAGRPRFGVDMDETTIPLEAGLGERAFDHTKGCYTGQEVVVRILHRGHVNERLCGLRWAGPAAAIRAGFDLFAPEERGERSAGRVTTVVDSPRMGAIALAYVRREVGFGASVTLADTGIDARVVDLEGDEWSPTGATTTAS